MSILHNVAISFTEYDGHKYRCTICGQDGCCSRCVINHVKRDHNEILIKAYEEFCMKRKQETQ